MRLLGKYQFDQLRDALQGVFGFSQVGSAYVIDLWQLRFSIVPNATFTIEVRGADNKYSQIGQIQLSGSNK